MSRDTATAVDPPVRFPELTVETPRLLIRPLAAADAPAVATVFDDRLTRRWMSLPERYTEAHARDWCTRLAAERRDRADGDHYGIVRREDGRLVGLVWTKRTDWQPRATEISYAVAPDARGYGFTAEAVDALAVDLILEHGMQRVELRVAAGNVASRRVAEKAGFTHEGLLRNAGVVDSGRVDLSVWSLVPADLRAAGTPVVRTP